MYLFNFIHYAILNSICTRTQYVHVQCTRDFQIAAAIHSFLPFFVLDPQVVSEDAGNAMLGSLLTVSTANSDGGGDADQSAEVTVSWHVLVTGFGLTTPEHRSQDHRMSQCLRVDGYGWRAADQFT